MGSWAGAALIEKIFRRTIILTKIYLQKRKAGNKSNLPDVQCILF